MHKSKKQEKTSEEITPDVFHEIFEKDRKQHEFMQSVNVPGDPSHTPPETRKGYIISTPSKSTHHVNDQDFYNAFDPTKKTSQSTISPDTFEDMIRKDKMKKDFVKKFTNVYEAPSSGSSSQNTIIIQNRDQHRQEVSSNNPPYPSSRGESLLITTDNAGQTARVLFCDLDRATESEIVSYLNKYWNNNCPFPSIFPMLSKLEREKGVGWRLDRISETTKINREAWPNSTINFDFPPQKAVFSIWRQMI